MPNDPQFNEPEGGFDDSGLGRPENGLSKNQKRAMIGLSVFAVLVIVLWLVQLKNSIYAPLNGPVGSADQSVASALDQQTANDLALKNKDTDGDGLSDYDELYVYKTSPYLADSDSDGLSDGTEVKNNTDPNCPQGRTCSASGSSSGSAAAPENSSAATLDNLLGQSQALDSLLKQSRAGNQAGQSGADSNDNLTEEQKQTLKNIDAANLRQMLIQAGMPKDTLDKISDADLMKSYGEVLDSQ